MKLKVRRSDISNISRTLHKIAAVIMLIFKLRCEIVPSSVFL